MLLSSLTALLTYMRYGTADESPQTTMNVIVDLPILPVSLLNHDAWQPSMMFVQADQPAYTCLYLCAQYLRLTSFSLGCKDRQLEEDA